MQWSQNRILDFAKELMATGDIRVGAENFNSQGVYPLRATCASEAWVSHINTGKDAALKIVQSID